jgi:hypothetical protein
MQERKIKNGRPVQASFAIVNFTSARCSPSPLQGTTSIMATSLLKDFARYLESVPRNQLIATAAVVAVPLLISYVYARYFFVPANERAVKFAWKIPPESE